MRITGIFAGGFAVAAIASGCCATSTETGHCGTVPKAAVTAAVVKSEPVAVTPAPKTEAAVGSRFDKPGFATLVKEGRLWVFAEGSESLAAYKASGKTPAVHVTRVKAGPEGMTVISPESETLLGYMVSKPGFHTVVEDGRLWVFTAGSEELAAYKASGKTPAVHATRIKAGPLGMTVIAPDLSVLDAYMK